MSTANGRASGRSRVSWAKVLVLELRSAMHSLLALSPTVRPAGQFFMAATGHSVRPVPGFKRTHEVKHGFGPPDTGAVACAPKRHCVLVGQS